VDETKRAGYVMAAVALSEPDAVRKVVRSLVAPGNRRLHMVDERPRHRVSIVDALVGCDIEVSIYDAARRYRTDREARTACLAAVVEDLAAVGGDTRLVIEQDRSLVRADRAVVFEAAHRSAEKGFSLHYDHVSSHEELLLALPDVAAWSWVRSGEWRRRLTPVLAGVRNV
jgi:hypothetical protein